MNKRRELVEMQNPTKVQTFWNGFMGIFYTLYMLISFFTILFGIVWTIYFSYYRYNLHNLTVGIVVTLFMVYLNQRRPS